MGRRSVSALIALVSVAASALTGTSAMASRSGSGDWRGIADGSDSLSVTGNYREAAQGGSLRLRSGADAPSRPAGSQPAANAERKCVPMLYTQGRYREVIVECDGAGGTELTPWFERSTGDGQGELPAPDVTIQPVVVSREDVQRLIVESGSLIVQPDRSWVLVSAETVVMTDASEHILRTRVLDLDVDVRVTPVLYTWDFGDGSAPLTGTDPGAPWPNHTVSHVYESAGTAVISLRTEWDAAFRVAGTSTWLPVAGRAATTQSTDPIEVLTATPRLTTG